jgi:hypothetical protein
MSRVGETTHCKFCGAEILFARTPARRLMPLDAEPVDASLVPTASRWDFNGDELRTWPVPHAGQGELVHIPHFGVCPETTSRAPANRELAERWETNAARRPGARANPRRG